MQNAPLAYPVQFSVDRPDRELNRLTTFFRLFFAIPILIVLASVVVACGGPSPSAVASGSPKPSASPSR